MLLLACFSAALFAQPSPKPPEAPPDVDQALRSRVSEFLNFHVSAEFRKAEALVAEDSKDVFYNRPKPHYISCKGISSIRYSENFTRAYVTGLCALPVPIMATDNEQQADGQPALPMGMPNVPIPMTWKIEDGKWCWYLDKELDRRSPFGLMAPPPASVPLPPGTVLPQVNLPPGMIAPTPPPGFGGPEAPPSDPAMRAAIEAAGRRIPVTDASFGNVAPEKLHHVKFENAEIALAPGASAKVKISNDAEDSRILMVMGQPAGIDAKLGTTNLDGGRSTSLDLKAAQDAKSGTLNLVVMTTGEMLALKITVR